MPKKKRASTPTSPSAVETPQHPLKLPCDSCGANPGEQCTGRTLPFRTVAFHPCRSEPGRFDLAIHTESRERRLALQTLEQGDPQGVALALVAAIASVPLEARRLALSCFCPKCSERKGPGGGCSCSPDLTDHGPPPSRQPRP